MANLDPNRLYVRALLRQIDNCYRFVVRWLPGASEERYEGDDLPTGRDTFLVSIKRVGAGLWLQADQRQWAPAPAQFRIKPKRYFMVDPPRKGVTIPGAANPTDLWLSASEPSAPVDPALTQLNIGNDASAAMGVCHLVDNLDKDRIAFRIADAFTKTAANYAAQKRLGELALNASEVKTAVEQIAIAMVRKGIRPCDLPALLLRERARLAGITREHATKADQTKAAADIAAAWRRLSLYAALAEDGAALAVADEEWASGTQTRQQLRLKALQGGDLIDFWSGLDAAQSPVPPASRGQIHSSSFALGLGDTFGSFSRQEVLDWRTNLRHGSSDIIMVQVTHELDPAAAPVFGFGKKGSGHLPARTSVNYTAGDAPLVDRDLERALNFGSSAPPLAPLRAWVNYDLVRSWVDPEAEAVPADGELATTLNFGTGDGKIEILIETSEPAQGEAAPIGFNVYGVWEGASPASDSWFSSNAPVPSIEALGPWLITRRYSLERDLKGALPPIGGNPHPNLVAALKRPPAHPALLRPDEVRDLGEGADSVLPAETNTADGGKRRFTVFGFDLRRGAQQQATLPADVPGAWDPVYPPQNSWTPHLWRGEIMPSGHANPQRYRFWVTAVDSYGQETAPIAVAAEDSAALEQPTPYFLPRIRTQLGPAPQADGTDPQALALTYNSVRGELMLRFSAPRAFQQGVNIPVGSQPPQLDPTSLSARVKILRRRLKPVLATTAYVGASSTDAIEESLAWRNALSPLRAAGWTDWHDELIRGPGATGWAIQKPIELNYLDQSHEYVALVGFMVKTTDSPFWHPYAARRRVQATKTETTAAGTQYKLVEEWIEENPSIGAPTKSSPVSVEALQAARSADRVSQMSVPALAKPILPPPLIDRDRVLMRLLANPAGIVGGIEPPRQWPDAEGPLMTEGQIAMCEAALDVRRYEASNTSDFPNDLELRSLRRALARLCAGGAGEPKSIGLSRNGLVGFRGVVKLGWQYRPLSAVPPRLKGKQPLEAEAGMFRIYGAIAPVGEASAAAAPVRVTARPQADGTIRLRALAGETISTGEIFETLRSGAQPTLIRFSTQGEPVFASLVSLTLSDSDVFVTLEALDGSLPTDISKNIPAQLFLGRVLREVSNTAFDAPANCQAWVPISGGPDEFFAWWVASVSAEQRQAPLHQFSSVSDWPVSGRRFAATVQPNPPERLEVRTVRDLADPYLDPTNPRHKPWCPTDLDKDGARYLPRIYLNWDQPGDNNSGLTKLYVEVGREFINASADDEALRALAVMTTPWQAIRTLNDMSGNEPIALDIISAIRDNWLIGEQLEMNVGFQADPFISVDDPDPKRRLVALGLGGTTSGLYRFIDYFAEPNVNRGKVMESDHRFRYRLRFVQELETNSDWKWLYSPWTEWSSHVLPVAPQLSVILVQEQSSAITGEITPPRVHFKFGSQQLVAEKANQAIDRREDADWIYRILLYRKVPAILAPNPGGADWLEIDAPKHLTAGGAAEIIDEMFEREEFEKPLRLRYRLAVEQIVRRGGYERPVRSLDSGPIEFDVDIRAPYQKASGSEEVRVTRIFNVR